MDAPYSSRSSFSLIILLSMLMMLPLAAQLHGFAGGSGTAEDPYQVETAAQLDQVRNYLGEQNADKHFLLVADIDLYEATREGGVYENPTETTGDEEDYDPTISYGRGQVVLSGGSKYISLQNSNQGNSIHNTDYWNRYESYGWEPIAHSWESMFTGRFDGNGHIISGMRLNRPFSAAVGLFGIIGETGVVENIVLEEVSIVGNNGLGALAGESAGEIRNVHASGSVRAIFKWDRCNAGGLVGDSKGYVGHSSFSGTVSGVRNIGGLVGSNYTVFEEPATVEFSHADAQVFGDYYAIGGLVGYNAWGSVVRNSYSKGNVGGAASVGGLVGANHLECTVENSYSMADVVGEVGVGGLAGANDYSQIINSYSVGSVTGQDGVGGLVGIWQYEFIEEHIINSYWNTETSGQEVSFGGEGRTTAEMTHPHDPDTYSSWDFAAVWLADTDGTVNDGYPYLATGEDADFAGGAGTEADPFLVATAEHLANVALHLSAHYLQINNIVAAEEIVIAMSYSEDFFNGVYDGGGYRITLMDNDFSLFGQVGEDGVLKNIDLVSEEEMFGASLAHQNMGRIENCHSSADVSDFHLAGGLVSQNEGAIIGSSTSGNVRAMDMSGGLVAVNYEGGLIENCHATGDVGVVRMQGGGLVGQNSGIIRDSYATGRVSVIIEDFWSFRDGIGGLVGINVGTVEESYATGDVDSQANPDQPGVGTGGLVGMNGGFIFDSYARNSVRGQLVVGGLVGMNYEGFQFGTGEPIEGGGYIENGFASGVVEGVADFGGLVGLNHTIVINSYWNTEISEITESDGGEGRSTAEMTHPYASNTYVDWDFAEVWAADTDGSVNGGYPYLRAADDVVGPEPVEYEDWAAAIPDPEQRGDHDAPAGDGIPNLLKFAIGLDPMTAYSPADVMAIYTPSGEAVTMASYGLEPQDEESSSGSFAIIFHRSKSAAGVQVFPEHSTDLLDGEWNTEEITEELIAEDSERETWKATAPVATRGFMRLQAVRE